MENETASVMTDAPLPIPGQTFHLTDIMDLYDFADDAVIMLTCLPTEYDKAGKLLSLAFGEREYSEAELAAERSAGSFPFGIKDGRWLGKPASWYILTYTPVELRDQCLRPYQERICDTIKCLVAKDRGTLGDDVSDETLLSIFALRWYDKLSLLNEKEAWARDHAIASGAQKKESHP